METLVTAALGARANSNTTGAFDVEEFDNFLVAGCAKATHVFGHPKSLEAVKKGQQNGPADEKLSALIIRSYRRSPIKDNSEGSCTKVLAP